nr:unnamed protein product [Digitaria exilis]
MAGSGRQVPVLWCTTGLVLTWTRCQRHRVIHGESAKRRADEVRSPQPMQGPFCDSSVLRAVFGLCSSWEHVEWESLSRDPSRVIAQYIFFLLQLTPSSPPARAAAMSLRLPSSSRSLARRIGREVGERPVARSSSVGRWLRPVGDGGPAVMVDQAAAESAAAEGVSPDGQGWNPGEAAGAAGSRVVAGGGRNGWSSGRLPVASRALTVPLGRSRIKPAMRNWGSRTIATVNLELMRNRAHPGCRSLAAAASTMGATPHRHTASQSMQAYLLLAMPCMALQRRLGATACLPIKISGHRIGGEARDEASGHDLTAMMHRSTRREADVRPLRGPTSSHRQGAT